MECASAMIVMGKIRFTRGIPTRDVLSRFAFRLDFALPFGFGPPSAAILTPVSIPAILKK